MKKRHYQLLGLSFLIISEIIFILKRIFINNGMSHIAAPSLFTYPIFPITIGIFLLIYGILYVIYKKFGWKNTYTLFKYLIITIGILIIVSYFSF